MRARRLVGLLILLAAPVHAAEPGPPEVLKDQPGDAEPPLPPTEEPNEPEPPPDPDAPPPERGINTRWYAGPPRWFGSFMVDLGVIYLRPRIAAGWGKPHAHWAGLEVNPIVSSDTLGLWGGLRLATPLLELRVGGRYMTSLGRTQLEQQHIYERADIELRTDEPASYAAYEAELSGGWDLGGDVDVFAEAAVTYVTGVTDGYNVFEEVIKVVVEPPWVIRLRAGWTFGIGFDGALKLGPMVEIVDVPMRGAFVLRGGIVARLKLYDDLEMRMTIAPTFGGRDQLGLRGADAFIIGLRYRWATGWSPTALAPEPPTAE